MGPPTNPAEYEDWNAYRKLIVDTLRRLDERTIQIYDEIQDHETRITVIERDDFEKQLRQISSDVNTVQVAFDKFSLDMERRISVQKGIMWAIGVGWTIVTVIAGIVIQVPNIFH